MTAVFPARVELLLVQRLSQPEYIHLQTGVVVEGMTTRLDINGRATEVEAAPDTPLLWVLRDVLGLPGTKYGCGMGLCGACTVHVDGQAMRSCAMPLSAVAGRAITTIEGLGGDHPLQRAWVAHGVPQCGYCQSGQIMSAAALLQTNPRPNRSDVESAVNGNICRCGTYGRIRDAILSVAEGEADEQQEE